MERTGKRITIGLDPDMIKILEARGKVLGLTLSTYCRMLILQRLTDLWAEEERAIAA